MSEELLAVFREMETSEWVEHKNTLSSEMKQLYLVYCNEKPLIIWFIDKNTDLYRETNDTRVVSTMNLKTWLLVATCSTVFRKFLTD